VLCFMEQAKCKNNETQVLISSQCRSEALARIAVKHQPHSTIVADILNLPHPHSRFDFAISIAVVHHLSTPERRVRAIAEILQTLKPANQANQGGKALIYVWALEQKSSRRGWDKGHQQDVMVPWVMRGDQGMSGQETTKTFHRYYHLYEEHELERDIRNAGGLVLDSGYEKDNWWAVAARAPNEKDK
jgi:tRNA (uracil-5-)-methyltransferase TRM9